MSAKTEIEHSELSTATRRRWTTPTIVVAKEASETALLLSGPADDGGFFWILTGVDNAIRLRSPFVGWQRDLRLSDAGAVRACLA